MEADGQSELERLRREIAERDDFVAFVGHELRNPMHTLSLQLASASALAESAGVPAVQKRIAMVQATLNRYIDRATLLLDLAQHQQRDYPVSLRPVDLAALLASFLDRARAEADYHGASLHFDAAGPCVVETDPLALDHVVGNLLSNAFKHAQCTRVEISLRQRDGYARIVIADDGRGIASEDQLRIFDKFERGTAPSLRAGSGLGLWIARRLVHALDGTISLESRLSEGCRFVLQIPMTRPTLTPHE